MLESGAGRIEFKQIPFVVPSANYYIQTYCFSYLFRTRFMYFLTNARISAAMVTIHLQVSF